MRLFRRAIKPTATVLVPTVLPSGTAVETDSGRFYIKGKNRYRITTDRIFASWSFPNVVRATEYAISEYPVAGKLGFRDGSLIKSISDGKLYIISESKKRHVVSPDALYRLGLTENEAILVSDAEVNLHRDGEVLS